VALSYGGVGKFCGESVSGHERGKVGFDVSLGKSVSVGCQGFEAMRLEQVIHPS
jgi:hypothetical protein